MQQMDYTKYLCKNPLEGCNWWPFNIPVNLFLTLEWQFEYFFKANPRKVESFVWIINSTSE